MLIKSFKIKNFRSLKDLQIDEFNKTTIIYGENNAGKSNILHALHLIFKRKTSVSRDDDKSTILNRPQSFIRGSLQGFNYNFFNNSYKDIKFEVEVELTKDELKLSKEVKFIVFGNDGIPELNTFTIKGFFKSIDSTNRDEANIEINIIQLNGVNIYIYNNKTDAYKYFPVTDPEGEKTGLNAAILSILIEPLNDCVSVVESYRDMHDTPFNSNPASTISPKTFKSFLYGLSLSTDKYHIFERINDLFNSTPFSFGDITFADDKGKLEIMVKKGGIRLPIKNMGSGVLQTLYIITDVIANNNKIVCIEELEQNLSPTNQMNTLLKLQSIINDTDISQLIISSHSPTFADSNYGLIYFIEKHNIETKIVKKEEARISKELTKHLSPALIVSDQMSKAELKRSFEEVKRATERRLRD